MVYRMGLLVLLVAVVFVTAWQLLGSTGGRVMDAPGEQQFLKRHWRTPIPPQGAPPRGFSPLESSLLPESCGSCHVRQYQDWQGSLHSRAMGPGVVGQTVVMEKGDPATARLCWSCHAPLSEQQPVLLQTAQSGEREWVANSAFDPDLQRHGVTCAACHVRQHRRFGPPRRETQEVTGKVDEGLPHAGFVAQGAFGSSDFCKGCHQFEPDGYALNGKLIENTWQEWRESGYPARGVQCQGCHMPDRRHLWRGIHDAETTRRGVTIVVETSRRNPAVGELFQARLTITNSGTGHYFPTYVTPRVVVSGVQADAGGVAIPATRQEMTIGREVTLDLSEEIFDSRIAPGASSSFVYVQKVVEGAYRLHLQIRVEPDYFYEKFFRTMLDEGLAEKGRDLIRQAWNDSRSSSYLLFEKVWLVEHHGAGQLHSFPLSFSHAD